MLRIFCFGRALQEIRDSRLYREHFSNFDDYCHNRWSFNRQRASQLIEASRSYQELAQSVQNFGHSSKPQLAQLPQVESHVAALQKAPAEERPAVWQRAVEATKGKPTAKAVEAAIDELRPGVGDEVRIIGEKHPMKMQTAVIIDDSDGVFVAETSKGTTAVLKEHIEITRKADPAPHYRTPLPPRPAQPPVTIQPAKRRPLHELSRAELQARTEAYEEILNEILR